MAEINLYELEEKKGFKKKELESLFGKIEEAKEIIKKNFKEEKAFE